MTQSEEVRMRRPLLALALVVGCVAATVQTASTASNSVPSSTAVYRETAVSGATLTSVSYTVTAGTITATRPRLRGINLLTKTVTARFGSSATVPCTAGLLTVLNAVTGLGEATYTCLGLSESADRPRKLQITVA